MDKHLLCLTKKTKTNNLRKTAPSANTHVQIGVGGSSC